MSCLQQSEFLQTPFIWKQSCTVVDCNENAESMTTKPCLSLSSIVNEYLQEEHAGRITKGGFTFLQQGQVT